MPIATPAPAKALLTPMDHTLILIDFQSQMAFATKSIDPVLLRNNAALVANAASIFMMGGAKAHYDGIVAFSQTDFTEDLKKITVPVLVMHGDDDQVVPYADSAPLSAKLLKKGTLKTYKGFPHGMPTTQAATINADLLDFAKAGT